MKKVLSLFFLELVATVQAGPLCWWCCTVAVTINLPSTFSTLFFYCSIFVESLFWQVSLIFLPLLYFVFVFAGGRTISLSLSPPMSIALLLLPCASIDTERYFLSSVFFFHFSFLRFGCALPFLVDLLFSLLFFLKPKCEFFLLLEKLFFPFLRWLCGLFTQFFFFV